MTLKIFMLPQPDIRPNNESGDYRYVLNENYSFSIIVNEKERIFTIKKGFKYDGATVPRVFMALIGFERDGIHRAGALIHDFLYVNNGVIIDANGVVFRYSRKDADRLFLKGIEHHGIKSWHGRLAYLAVRGLGWLYRRF